MKLVPSLARFERPPLPLQINLVAVTIMAPLIVASIRKDADLIRRAGEKTVGKSALAKIVATVPFRVWTH